MIFIENFSSLLPCQRTHKLTQVLPVGPANTKTFARLFVREPTFITHFHRQSSTEADVFFAPRCKEVNSISYVSFRPGGGVQYAELQKIWKLRYAK